MTKVFLRPNAIAGFEACPPKIRTKANQTLDVLRRGSFPPHTKKLEGAPNGYRIRIGRWRILFVLKNGEVDVTDIFLKQSRGDYRRL